MARVPARDVGRTGQENTRMEARTARGRARPVPVADIANPEGAWQNRSSDTEHPTGESHERL